MAAVKYSAALLASPSPLPKSRAPPPALIPPNANSNPAVATIPRWLSLPRCEGPRGQPRARPKAGDVDAERGAREEAGVVEAVEVRPLEATLHIEADLQARAAPLAGRRPDRT